MLKTLLRKYADVFRIVITLRETLSDIVRISSDHRNIRQNYPSKEEPVGLCIFSVSNDGLSNRMSKRKVKLIFPILNLPSHHGIRLPENVFSRGFRKRQPSTFAISRGGLLRTHPASRSTSKVWTFQKSDDPDDRAYIHVGSCIKRNGSFSQRQPYYSEFSRAVSTTTLSNRYSMFWLNPCCPDDHYLIRIKNSTLLQSVLFNYGSFDPFSAVDLGLTSQKRGRSPAMLRRERSILDPIQVIHSSPNITPLGCMEPNKAGTTKGNTSFVNITSLQKSPTATISMLCSLKPSLLPHPVTAGP